ncbi:MAG: hypothetical protein CVV13_14630 [Gammaproteobacteria bacterium HGW-Gammaproteobacteria-3]|nr:MAG: hypothetical protein CVV13_14630 [Gammaproteobacteria bacterium HGW-Gammaproteobacteria-3]
MKLKKLNKALIAAGLVAGSAITAPVDAVMLSNDGLGEVLFCPFYTVQGPQDAARTTLFSVVNHNTSEYKAVKVRFHEAHNSRDALDFNLYLSPGDVWTGTLSRDADGVATLSTTDKSCTIPTSIMTEPTPFKTLAFTQAANNDGGNQDALRTNEGYFEVIEMGVIDKDALLLTTGSSGPLSAFPGIDTFGEAIKHVNGLPGGALGSDGVPVGCAALQEAAVNTNGTWKVPNVDGVAANLDNAHVAVAQPTGDLSGTVLVVQPSLGTVTSFNTTPLKHFYDVAPASDSACTATPGGNTGTEFCETNGVPLIDASTTNRAFDDLHSFKDLDPTTANSRSVQTYPNIAMAFPQISTHVTPDTLGGTLTVLEWADNEAVSSGITQGSAPEYFASVKDLDLALSNDASAVLSAAAAAAAADCGGTDGVPSVVATDGICANARPVSAVLAVTNLKNEFVLEQDAASGVDFRTDIIVAFPTKWYFSDNGVYDPAAGKVLDAVGGIEVSALEALAQPPFTAQFVSKGSKRDQACEKFTFSVWDREEGKPSSTPGVLVPSPAINVTAPGNFFCHEANVISLNDGDLLSSRIANGLTATVADSAGGTNAFNIDLPNGILSGWFDIAFDAAHTVTSVAAGGPAEALVTAITPSGIVKGLPALGAVSEGLVSGADGFFGNFTAGIPHKRVVEVSVP